MKTEVEKFVEDPANMRSFLQERAILNVTTQLEDAMRERKVSRAGLARRLGKSRGWLDGEGNKTLRTIADAFAVIGLEFHSSYGPIKISNLDD